MTAVYNKSEPSNSLPVVPSKDSPQKSRQLEIVSFGSLHDGKRPLVLHKSDKQLLAEERRGIRHLRLLDRTLREKLFYMRPNESRLFGQLVDHQIVCYQQRNLKEDCLLHPHPAPPQSVLANRATVQKSLEKQLEKIPDEFIQSFRSKARRLPAWEGSAPLLLKASVDNFKAHKAASTGNLFRLRSQPRQLALTSSVFGLTQPAEAGSRPVAPSAEQLLLKHPSLNPEPRSQLSIHGQSRGYFVRQNIQKQREQSENRSRAVSQKQLAFVGWRQLLEQQQESQREDIFNGD